MDKIYTIMHFKTLNISYLLIVIISILAIGAAKCETIQSDIAIVDTVNSTDLVNESTELLDWQSLSDEQTGVVKVTTEVLYKEGTNVEYYFKETVQDAASNKTISISVPKKVKIITNKEEIPKIEKPKKSPEPLPKPKEEIITYVDTVDIKGDDFPDYNAPVLSDKIGINDPIEGFNRVMFIIDGGIYTYFVGPIGKGYRYIMPIYFRKGFSRMDYNIQLPKHLLNNLLQAEFKGAGVEVGRFLINSTIGILGFYDPAKNWLGMERYDADLGQTLAKWGIGDGCYVYLPIISSIGESTTPRDIIGAIIDDQLDPRAWIPFGGSSIRFLMKFNNMTLNLDTIDRLQQENFDPYILRRDIGHLIRESEIIELRDNNNEK